MSSDPGVSARRAELIDALISAFRMVSAQAVLLSQAAADRLGMASSDIECFDLLSLYGPMTAGRLASLTGLTTGAITGVIDRLERAGYARRERDPADRRRVIVQPILERHADAAPVFEPVAAATRALLARYSDDELALFLDLITQANLTTHEQIVRLRSEGRAVSGEGRPSRETSDQPG